MHARDLCVCGKCSVFRAPELLCEPVRCAMRHPQDLIANHCAALLAPVRLPGDDVIACALELARQNLVTDHVLEALISHIGDTANGHRHGAELRATHAALRALLGPDAVAATVGEIRDSENLPVWRVDNPAGTRLYAWMDSRGWESTRWGQRHDRTLDRIAPVPGRDDLRRDAFPVGLAALIVAKLASLDTSETDTWGDP